MRTLRRWLANVFIFAGLASMTAGRLIDEDAGP